MKLNQILPITFNKKLFLGLYISFIVATAVGNLTYCLGGYIAGKCLGYNLQIHYAYIDHPNDCDAMKPLTDSIKTIREKYPDEIKNKLDFPEKEKYESINNIIHQRIKDGYYVGSAEALTPILIGTIGFILLIIYRRRFKDKTSLSFWQWALVFKSLFWLRESFNLTMGLIFITFSTKNYKLIQFLDYSVNRLLGLPDYTFPIIAGCIGLIILAIVVFKFIPKNQRLTFLASGLAGGMSGAYIWLHLGKFILP